MARYIALIAVLFLLGCSEERQTQWAHDVACASECWHRTVSKLDNIDHEQPSAEALREVAAVCERYASPCCFKRGIGYFTCLPARGK